MVNGFDRRGHRGRLIESRRVERACCYSVLCRAQSSEQRFLRVFFVARDGEPPGALEVGALFHAWLGLATASDQRVCAQAWNTRANDQLLQVSDDRVRIAPSRRPKDVTGDVDDQGAHASSTAGCCSMSMYRISSFSCSVNLFRLSYLRARSCMLVTPALR